MFAARRRLLVALVALVLSALLAVPSGAVAAPTAAAATGTLSGTAIAPDGRGVEGLWVYAYRRGAEHWESVEGAVATTDAQGRYSMTMEPDRYRIQFIDPRGRYLNVHHGGADEFDYDGATLVTLAAGSTVTGVDVLLRPAASVHGRVTTATGGVVGSVQVSALRKEVGPGGAVTWRAVQNGYTDGSSTYLVPNLEAGTYRLQFSKSGFITEYYDGGQGADDLASAKDVVLAEGQVVEINASLSWGSAISGTVTVPEAGPALNGFVNVLSQQGGRWEVVAGSFVGWQGRYHVGGLKAGTYKVTVGDFDNRHAARFWPNVATVEQASTITIRDRDTTVTGIDFDFGVPVLNPVTQPPTAPSAVSFARNPRVAGKPVVGKQLRVRHGAVSPSTATVTYTWYAGKRKIKRAHGPRFQVTRALVGRRISVRIAARAPDHARTVAVLRVAKLVRR